MENDLKLLRDALCLLACAINDMRIPERVVSRMDVDALLRLGRAHSVDALMSSALIKALPGDRRCLQCLGACMTQSDKREAAWRTVRAWLETNGLWYAPLKGMVLQADYPHSWLRQMSDYDVLVDPSRRAELRAFMESEGFEAERLGGKEDVYRKPPYIHFEMHAALFDPAHTIEPICRYYRDVRQRLVPVAGDDARNCLGFQAEDFYVYLTAHAYMHYDWAGHGLRNLADLRCYLRTRRDELDWACIERECRAQGIAEYERLMRGLSDKLLSPEATAILASTDDWRQALGLTQSEWALLSNCAASGVYGTLENRLNHRLDDLDRASRRGPMWLRYVALRVFPPRSAIQLKYPRLGKHPILWRLGYGLRALEAAKQAPRFLSETIAFSRLARGSRGNGGDTPE